MYIDNMVGSSISSSIILVVMKTVDKLIRMEEEIGVKNRYTNEEVEEIRNSVKDRCMGMTATELLEEINSVSDILMNMSMITSKTAKDIENKIRIKEYKQHTHNNLREDV